MCKKFWSENLKLGVLDKQLTIILKWLLRFREHAGGIWHRAGLKRGSCEYGNKLSGSINSQRFTD
jgi:hypothetical protein